MKPFRRGWGIVLALLAIAVEAHAHEPAIELRDGDHIALIGGTLIEREQRYGYWEYVITAAHPDKRLTFRNLGWSADTVWADSRGIFDPPAKGYERLIQQVAELQPTVFLLNYGQNEAWAGPAGLDSFIAQYRKLIDDLANAASAKGMPRFVLLSPLPMEPNTGPRREAPEYNANVERYSAAIATLAKDRQIPFIDLAEMYQWDQQQSANLSPEKRRPLTENGLHLSPYGYWRTAPWLRERLCAGTTVSQIVPLTPVGTPAGKPLKATDEELTKLIKSAFQSMKYTQLPRPTPEELREAAAAGRDIGLRGVSVSESGDLILYEGPDYQQATSLLEAIRHKNELYFHRWRPQNITYLFLFRKHEQGQNAAEIPKFDPLVAEEEARIEKLKVPVPRTLSPESSAKP